MPIPLQEARDVLNQFDVSRISNLFAQAHAKHVLYEVRELSENFPSFDPILEDKVTFAAYGVLAAGSSIAEQGDRASSASALERAASLLQHVHGPFAKGAPESAFHVLVAAMAFYAAGHYSRAFVAIRSVEGQTEAGRAIAAFLRKDNQSLIEILNDVLLREPPSFDEQHALDSWGITLAISRAIASALEFTFTGAREKLFFADEQLRAASVVAATMSQPGWWWVVRLLRLMFADLDDSSPWRVLPPYFSPDATVQLARYIRLLAFARTPVSELWTSQRAALPLALGHQNRGAVVNLRTSAGKTRVAELAILQALFDDPGARVLYLAPFRSLALEVEHTLSSTFRWLGYGVSHLYGGSRVSSVDTELAAESPITIATPEKARALLRAEPELFDKLKLLIIDEGHLIGPTVRHVRNEVFVDHLRGLAAATSARILLLSAVLPNAEELATWITGDATAVARSTWKPSAERFGLLRWNGSRVRLEWRGEIPSFNPSFVEAKPLGFGRRRTLFPRNKAEAIAATAIRLSAIGPVMIFTARAVSVPTLAEAVLLALGDSPQDHPWPLHEWKVFEAVAREELDADAIEIRAARAGILCHSNRLAPQVRLALEHLMRSKPPKIIVATTTLAQGVNVGVSSVIVATPYIDQRTIGKRDFWNICGRAGRAFVDGEGKILYAVDDTRAAWQIAKDVALAQSYFATGTEDPVESGLLYALGVLRGIAQRAGVSFDVLLELAANNDFSRLASEAKRCEFICDLLDDELLALHSDPAINVHGVEDSDWVEPAFRDSLAVLQARARPSGPGPQDVIAFLKARTDSVLRRVPRTARNAIVRSGLPLSVALRAHENLEVFRGVADSYNEGARSVNSLSAAVRAVEDWARVNAKTLTGDMPNELTLTPLRVLWLAGIGLRALRVVDAGADDVCKDLYGFHLPWVIHAASQQLRADVDADRADTLATIALLVELGVPTELAARIFLAGVRSRAAATELAGLSAGFGDKISEIGRRLRDIDFTRELRPLLSADTVEWLDLLVYDASRSQSKQMPEFQPFTLNASEGDDVLHARRFGARVYLCSEEGRSRHTVTPSTDSPFDQVANDPRIAFRRFGPVWKRELRDPRLAGVGLRP